MRAVLKRNSERWKSGSKVGEIGQWKIEIYLPWHTAIRGVSRFGRDLSWVPIPIPYSTHERSGRCMSELS